MTTTQPCAVCKDTRVAYETSLFWSEAHPCTACAPKPIRWPEPSPEALKHLDGLCDRIWQNEGGVTGKELYANVCNILEACPRRDEEPWNIVPYDKWHASQAICEANYMLLRQDHADMIRSRDYWRTRAGGDAGSAPGPVWRHVKRGTHYTEIARAELQLHQDKILNEGDTLVVYRGDDGKVWARWEYEFEDGRFTREPVQKLHTLIGKTPTVIMSDEIEVEPSSHPGVIGLIVGQFATAIIQFYDRIERTAARLGCTEEVARQIVTGQPEARQ